MVTCHRGLMEKLDPCGARTVETTECERGTGGFRAAAKNEFPTPPNPRRTVPSIGFNPQIRAGSCGGYSAGAQSLLRQRRGQQLPEKLAVEIAVLVQGVVDQP